MPMASGLRAICPLLCATPFTVLCQIGVGRRQPSPDPDRPDRPGEPGLVVGLDHRRAQSALALRRREALAGHLLYEAQNGAFLLHADDRVVVAAHADIGLVGRPAGQYPAIGSRDVTV